LESVGLLVVKSFGNRFDDTRDTSVATQTISCMHVRLADLGVPEDLLNKVKSAREEIPAELFETHTSVGSVEVDSLKERVDFDGCLGCRRNGTLGMLASVRRRQTTWESTMMERSPSFFSRP
jgi:hypothetical protein